MTRSGPKGGGADGGSGLRARLAILGAAALFSTGGAAIKATALGSWEVAGLRSGLAALFLWLALPAARRAPGWPALGVGGAYAVTMILFVTANKLTTAANTIFLQSTAPLWLLLLAPRLLGERVRQRDLMFMSALAAGMALFFVGTEAPSQTAPDPTTGNLLAATSGVTWALTLLGLRALGRSADGGLGAGQAAFLGNLVAVVVCLPPVLLGGGGEALAGAGVVDWAVIAYLGVVQIGLAYVLLTRAVREVPALEASLLLLTEPVLNPILAWLVLGETARPVALAGGALILGATAVKTWFDRRRS